MKRFFALVLTITLMCCMLTACNDESAINYNKATKLLESGDYEEAYSIFEELGDYKDAKTYLSRFHYVITDKATPGEGKTKTVTYTYNDKNLPVRSVVSEDDTSYTYDYSYNDEGYLIQQIETKNNGDKKIYDYTYGADGNMVKKICTHPNGNTDTRQYTYNDKGNIIKEVYDSFYGSVTTEYTYGDKGELIKRLATSASGETGTETYTYDDAGNLVKYVNIDSAGYYSTYEYTYNYKGDLVKLVYTGSNDYTPRIYIETIEYTYGEHGNIVEESAVCNDGTTQSAKTNYKLVFIPYDISEEVINILHPEPFPF